MIQCKHFVHFKINFKVGLNLKQNFKKLLFLINQNNKFDNALSMKFHIQKEFIYILVDFAFHNLGAPHSYLPRAPRSLNPPLVLCIGLLRQLGG